MAGAEPVAGAEVVAEVVSSHPAPLRHHICILKIVMNAGRPARLAFRSA